ncbi:hypothetical protein HaLaN_18982, partial [Haematococcus lacustris]
RALPQVADTDLRRYRARHFAATPASYPRATHEVVDHPGLWTPSASSSPSTSNQTAYSSTWQLMSSSASPGASTSSTMRGSSASQSHKSQVKSMSRARTFTLTTISYTTTCRQAGAIAAKRTSRFAMMPWRMSCAPSHDSSSQGRAGPA